MHSSGFFRIKLIARLILKRKIMGSHTISDQSLLLSTNVLDDSFNKGLTAFRSNKSCIRSNKIKIQYFQNKAPRHYIYKSDTNQIGMLQLLCTRTGQSANKTI